MGSNPRYYISVVLEMPNKESFVDTLADVVVHMINFDPLPYVNRVMIGMTLNNQVPQQ